MQLSQILEMNINQCISNPGHITLLTYIVNTCTNDGYWKTNWKLQEAYGKKLCLTQESIALTFNLYMG